MSSVTPLAPDVDVLVVGAGPTGLTLACQLARFGVRFRIVDKQPDRARESRALGVQARSLEVLQALGLGEALAARGRTTTRLMLHVDRDPPVAIDLGAVPRADTRFPYILFVSQSDTEAVLSGYLEAADALVERRVELVGCREDSTGVACVLRHEDGREETVHASYLVGCDGAHSAVRKGADIASKAPRTHRRLRLATSRQKERWCQRPSTRSLWAAAWRYVLSALRAGDMARDGHGRHRPTTIGRW